MSARFPLWQSFYPRATNCERPAVTLKNASPAELKAQMKALGITVREWSKKHGFRESSVHAVLNGKNKASRGDSFRIAVALGIKTRAPIEDAPEFIKEMLEAQERKRAKEPEAKPAEIVTLHPADFWYQRLRIARLRMNLTIQEAADLGGVNRITQYNYEAGKTSPSLAYLANIQDKIDIRYVLFNEHGRVK
jgi:gp16 family phage-associated protein